MPVRVEGAEQLRALAVELKAADRALLLRMKRNIRAAAVPAGKAVQAEERAVLPKRGGLNEWVASARVGTRILSGPRTAGVRLVQGRKGSVSRASLRLMNEQGMVRHPNRGGYHFGVERRAAAGGWSTTKVPQGFFERPLLAMEPEVRAAMIAVMDETARVAGFRGP